MNREDNMPDGSQCPERNSPSSAEPLPSGRPDGLSGPQTRADASQIGHGDGHHQFIEELKRGLENTRLPADLREQILAQLPPPEERERLFRELQEKGGMSFGQLMESLGLEVHPQP